MVAELKPSDYQGRWWVMLPDVRVECRLCPRFCKLNEGQRGFCFVRQRLGDRMILTTYGRSSGFCVDPIEKKPLNHFLPGSSVLSFGTAGCNLGCRFCQNWDISKAREWDKLADAASPEQIALAAQRLGCRSVAFTYNDPVIFAEYAIDVAQACRERGIKASPSPPATLPMTRVLSFTNTWMRQMSILKHLPTPSITGFVLPSLVQCSIP